MKALKQTTPNNTKLKSHNPDQTREFGYQVGEGLNPGDLILLVGGLGTGKTCFTQGLALALGVEDYVTSPSYVLIKEYQGKHRLHHIDFYRLTDSEEITDLGIDEYLQNGGICVIEWADRSMAALPEQYLLIQFDYLPGDQRLLQFESKGTRFDRILPGLILKWNS